MLILVVNIVKILFTYLHVLDPTIAIAVTLLYKYRVFQKHHFSIENGGDQYVTVY